MHMTIKRITFITIFLFIISPVSVFAHPGKTDSDGCHYCRTNCDKWGVPRNERHCHNGGTIKKATVQPKTPTRVPTKIPRPTKVPTQKPTPTLVPSNTPSITIIPTKIISPIPTVKTVNIETKPKSRFLWFFGRK
jgi:hypothetical protein